MNSSAAVRAHTNIALIKYWGKRDTKLFLPTSPSLSLTLDALYTDTRVALLNASDSTVNPTDEFYLDGEKQTDNAVERITNFANLFRALLVDDDPRKNAAIRVESYNHVPTAAGLASSSSAFAALAWALRDLYGLTEQIDDERLSTFARQGSGSATRSIFGGFVEWTYGSNPTDVDYCADGSDSHAVPIDDGKWDVALIAVALSTKKKKISSRIGMQHTVETSSFYPLWRSASEHDLALLKDALCKHDLEKIGETMEANCMKFHATMFSANPPITYLTSKSWEVIEFVHALREGGIPAYFTMDAGPNVKVLCCSSQAEEVAEKLHNAFPEAEIFTSRSGDAPRSLSEQEWGELYGE